MTPDEFWCITPRYFDALVERHELKLERARRESDMMIAQLTAVVINFSQLRPEDSVRTDQFLPTYRSDRNGITPKRRRESFDTQIKRAMERAVTYQAGQVAKGL